MNKWIGKGRLTGEPEIRMSADGQTKIARYSLAINRRGEGADFIRCIAFGKSADFSEKYMNKGAEFVVEGRIQTGSYKDKDNKTVYTTDIIVENQEFCGSKADNEKPVINPDYESFMEIDDSIAEELPFN